MCLCALVFIGGHASAQTAPAAWSDLSSVSLDGFCGLKLGDVMEPPAGVKQGDTDVGLRFPLKPKKTPLPAGLRCTVMVTKKTHKLESMFLESDAVSDAEWEALKAALTKKFGAPQPDVMETGMPTWGPGLRSLTLMRTSDEVMMSLTDIKLTGQALDEND